MRVLRLALFCCLAVAGCADDDPAVPGGGGGGPVAEDLFPAWSEVAPTRTIDLLHDPGLSPEQNGARLRDALRALVPGERLRIGGGTWTSTSLLSVDVAGGPDAPIFVEGRGGSRPVITRPDAAQNLLNLGTPGRTAYVALRGLELRGGAVTVALSDADHVWIDDCVVSGATDAGIQTFGAMQALTVTRCTVADLGAQSGTGIYVGRPDGTARVRAARIGFNEVRDVRGVSFARGIAVQPGSVALVYGNDVLDVDGPGILLFGSADGLSGVRRNRVIGCGDPGIQVATRVDVVNNVVLARAHPAFRASAWAVGDGFLVPESVRVVSNTFVSGLAAETVRIADWQDPSLRALVFADNAVVSESFDAIRVVDAPAAFASGNVVSGGVTGLDHGFVAGNGAGDFVDFSFDLSRTDVTPALGGALVGRVTERRVDFDVNGRPRALPYDVGAVERP